MLSSVRCIRLQRCSFTPQGRHTHWLQCAWGPQESRWTERCPLGQHADFMAQVAVTSLAVLRQGELVEKQLKFSWEVSSELLWKSQRLTPWADLSRLPQSEQRHIPPTETTYLPQTWHSELPCAPRSPQVKVSKFGTSASLLTSEQTWAERESSQDPSPGQEHLPITCLHTSQVNICAQSVPYSSGLTRKATTSDYKYSQHYQKSCYLYISKWHHSVM